MARSSLPFALAALLLAPLAGRAAPAAPKPAKPPLEGTWEAPGGTLSLTRHGERVTGALAQPADGSPLAAGQAVLEGTFADDNLAAEVRLGVVAPACGAEEGKAYVLLLLTRSGKLTGAVTTTAACAKDLGSLTLQKAAAPAPAPKREPQPKTAAATKDPAPRAHPMPGPAPQAGSYDPRGQRTEPLPVGVRDILRDGEHYMQEGQFERARERFLKAIAKDPTVGEAYNGVGVTYAMRNDYDQAIDWYKRGLEAAPGFGDLYYNLACSYAMFGKKNIALRYLKLAAQKGYTDAENLDKDGDLASLRDEPEFKAIRELMDVPPPPAPR